MKTLRVISALFVVTITAAALHAQLIQINYTGAFAYTRGGPYDEPVSDPIPFHATAIFDSATPGARYGPYMVFDTSTWSFDHPNQPNFLRWQFLTYDLVFPSTSIYLRDSGRFDVVYDGHIPFINLQLYLSHGSESTHLPLPPFFAGHRWGLARARSGRLHRDREFLYGPDYERHRNVDTGS